ncbi:aminotransferase class V-fold PLP-dependent enzyme [Paenibacillus gansuensis]|uniref:Aminotransferase class V-fold PLP-dependent enzyme n=1 Tax=Paenibacillus gansuensis TaxID=306542 RepID=A0ABW5PKT5_9BACL
MSQLHQNSTREPDWDAVRSLFRLDPDYIHLGSSQFIASHPLPVREAIGRYRVLLDSNPVHHTMQLENKKAQEARISAARYMGIGDPNLIALTDSTTMGLGMTYAGIHLREGQEILVSEFSHYSHQESIRKATERSKARFTEMKLYEHLSSVTEQGIIEAVLAKVSDKTRIIALTWVHSNSGLKTPVAAIAKSLDPIRERRAKDDRLLLIVDGVHGFGIETEMFDELGCDIFVTACHKWTYGPRGTGFVAATDQAWQEVTPIIPDYTERFKSYSDGNGGPGRMDGKIATPGGFHALEHRWALSSSFELMESLGRQHVYNRVHKLNRICKEGLADMGHVQVHTPLKDELSSGIVAFEVKGMDASEVVKRLAEKKIIATAAPYRVSYARFTPGIYNSESDIERALDAVSSLKA